MEDSALDASGNSWTHPSLILVATDLTDLERLMPFALDQASDTGARLILLHSLAPSAALSMDPAGISYYDPSSAVQFATNTLEPWCVFARRHHIVCDALIREGNPAQQIATALVQFQVDRILLGTRSRGRLGKLLLGSVAEQVLRSVNLPVITVGPEAHLSVDKHERVVLHATMLREASRPSAALACQIAASQRAKLVLLHVLPPIDPPLVTGMAGSERSGLDSNALHVLRVLGAESGAGCCADIEPIVVHGNPAIEILAEASERRADLIVLGATHRSAFENLTRDRTIHRILAHARCPVLTLREPPAAQQAAAWAHRIAMHL
jgi:nucleotide-binding universal stress UspA family protein